MSCSPDGYIAQCENPPAIAQKRIHASSSVASSLMLGYGIIHESWSLLSAKRSSTFSAEAFEREESSRRRRVVGMQGHKSVSSRSNGQDVSSVLCLLADVLFPLKNVQVLGAEDGAPVDPSMEQHRVAVEEGLDSYRASYFSGAEKSVYAKRFPCRIFTRCRYRRSRVGCSKSQHLLRRRLQHLLDRGLEHVLN